jgi:hypothetical protein
MKRLGYSRFVAQGGDWGGMITDVMGRQAPPELLGIHLNWIFGVPPEIDKAIQTGSALPSDLSAEERSACDRLASFYKSGTGYAIEMGNRPQTIYAMADSPVGLAAWMLDHDPRSYEMIARAFDGQREGLTRDDVLDNVTLTWLTNNCGLVRTHLLGKQIQLLHAERSHRTCRSERLPRRGLSGPAELGRTGLSKAHLLQPTRKRRALRRLGAARSLRGGSPCRIQYTALASRHASSFGLGASLNDRGCSE